MDGPETNKFFERVDDRTRPGHAELKKIVEKVFGVGEVVAMPTGGIHMVWNETDRVTLSLHIYGKHINFTGRSQFDPRHEATAGATSAGHASTGRRVPFWSNSRGLVEGFSGRGESDSLRSREGKLHLAAQHADETRNQTMMREQGPAFRIYTPTRRLDHEGNAYSLNKKLLDEYMVYPYSAHDDGLDTASRWNDMEMRPPLIIDERDFEPEVFVDGS